MSIQKIFKEVTGFILGVVLVLWASLIAQLVNHLPEMQETQVRFLGWEIPWRRKWQPTPVCFLENPMDRGAWQAIVHGIARVGHD